MTKEEAQELYKNKEFYNISRHKETNSIGIYGPYDNIYYVVSNATNITGETFSPNIKFCQVINGKIVQTFTEDEILVMENKQGVIKCL